MEKSENTPSAEELLTRILELEGLHARIKQEIISKLRPSAAKSSKPDHQTHKLAVGKPHANRLIQDGLMDYFTETQCSNVMLSMGPALHIFDLKYRIYYWNRTAQEIYGYTPDEVYGKTPIQILLADPTDAVFANYLLERTVSGESWSGEYPVTDNRGETFMVLSTLTPFRDGRKKIIGGMCISSDSRPYRKIYPGLRVGPPTRFDVQQPRQTSKLSNLALKLKLKMKIDHEGMNDHSEDETESEANTPKGHINCSSPFGVFISADSEEERSTENFTTSSSHKTEKKIGIRETLSSKADEWMAKKRNVWPWKRNVERDVESLNAKLGYFGWQRLYTNQGHETDPPKKGYESVSQMCFAIPDDQLCENTSKEIEAPGLWLSTVTLNTTSTSSSDSSSKSKANIRVEKETYNVDYEILWEDVITKERIGQGSCGTVYHGLWHGSDIAVKLFTYQEFSDNVMLSFKQEVSLMKRLRHPNILLFMGAVTSPQHLCIVTEFLPRGSLFQVLQRNSTQLDWRRRLHMAMDIARGMNYLHHYNPPIVHRDLKSSNLLVDKNWSIKVGDFGLSRIRHQTYLKTKGGKGTPQWMAPEVIRNEHTDEKSDVYSFGVVLWEIITEKIPWDDLKPMQVIAAVGFMNRRLEIPKDVHPLWTSLIESCWYSEPQSRPTFQEILVKLKELQKMYTVERIRR